MPLFVESILSGQELFSLFPGDLTGIALGHDLHVLVTELIEHIEDTCNGKANGGNQGVDNPQAVQCLGALLDSQSFQLGKIGGLHSDPVEQSQQEQGQGGGHGRGDLHGEGLDGEGDALGADAGFVLAVFGTVGGEHEGQNMKDTRNISL